MQMNFLKILPAIALLTFLLFSCATNEPTKIGVEYIKQYDSEKFRVFLGRENVPKDLIEISWSTYSDDREGFSDKRLIKLAIRGIKKNKVDGMVILVEENMKDQDFSSDITFEYEGSRMINVASLVKISRNE